MRTRKCLRLAEDNALYDLVAGRNWKLFGQSAHVPILLMLPMKWGIIDVAQKAGVKIVPISLEYEKEESRCNALVGNAINSDEYSLADGINYLRDSIASLRWSAGKRKVGFPEQK